MKLHVKNILLLFLIVTSFNNSILIASDKAEIYLKNLKKKYDSMKDATIMFTQHIVFGVTKVEQTFQGKLLMKKVNKYRLELEEQIIVTDGSSVWSISKINNQVIIDKYKEDPEAISPDKVLVNVPDNYNSTLIGKEKFKKYDTAIIKLLPKKTKVNFKWIKVWIDEDEYLIRKVQVLDVNDNLITYNVEEIKINDNLPDNIFKYEIPSDLEVIDLR